MRTEDRLVQKFGVLMTLADLAGVLNRSQDGLRMTMHGKSDLGLLLRKARRKIGRRVHFRTEDIARIVDEGVA
ncbi:DNA-binding protein [Chitinivorax sp. PXF-14]|uniref:DNA-binding protein n=1 Tax=Chitinivorax sp. PXF-14 TaxID=3230488 RepID=UPI00346586EE